MKHRDWRARLHKEVERWRRRPYRLGRADCALFVADCIRAMTGDDPAAAFRGRYGTVEEAKVLLAQAGNLLAVARSYAQEVPVGQAVFGDIAVLKSEDQFEHLFGLVNGETVLVLHASGGLGAVPRSMMMAAFRV